MKENYCWWKYTSLSRVATVTDIVRSKNSSIEITIQSVISEV